MITSNQITIQVNAIQPVLTSIKLTSNASSIEAGQSVILTAQLLDQNDKLYVGSNALTPIMVTFTDSTTGASTTAPASLGIATANVELSSAGTYSFYAEA